LWDVPCTWWFGTALDSLPYAAGPGSACHIRLNRGKSSYIREANVHWHEIPRCGGNRRDRSRKRERAGPPKHRACTSRHPGLLQYGTSVHVYLSLFGEDSTGFFFFCERDVTCDWSLPDLNGHIRRLMDSSQDTSSRSHRLSLLCVMLGIGEYLLSKKLNRPAASLVLVNRRSRRDLVIILTTYALALGWLFWGKSMAALPTPAAKFIFYVSDSLKSSCILTFTGGGRILLGIMFRLQRIRMPLQSINLRLGGSLMSRANGFLLFWYSGISSYRSSFQ